MSNEEMAKAINAFSKLINFEQQLVIEAYEKDCRAISGMTVFLMFRLSSAEHLSKRIVFRALVLVDQAVGTEHVAQDVHFAFQVDEAVGVQRLDLLEEGLVDGADCLGDAGANLTGLGR